MDELKQVAVSRYAEGPAWSTLLEGEADYSHGVVVGGSVIEAKMQTFGHSEGD